MKKKRAPGRPKKDPADKHSELVRFYVKPAQMAGLIAIAGGEEYLGEWCRDVCLRAAGIKK